MPSFGKSSDKPRDERLCGGGSATTADGEIYGRGRGFRNRHAQRSAIVSGQRCALYVFCWIPRDRLLIARRVHESRAKAVQSGLECAGQESSINGGLDAQVEAEHDQ
jgi:hypothetical protein